MQNPLLQLCMIVVGMSLLVTIFAVVGFAAADRPSSRRYRPESGFDFRKVTPSDHAAKMNLNGVLSLTYLGTRFWTAILHASFTASAPA